MSKLDFVQKVPLMKRMLDAGGEQGVYERKWMLQLLIVGMQSEADGEICRYGIVIDMYIASVLLEIIFNWSIYRTSLQYSDSPLGVNLWCPTKAQHIQKHSQFLNMVLHVALNAWCHWV